MFWGGGGDSFDAFMLFYFHLHKLVVSNAGGGHLVMLRVQGEKGEKKYSTFVGECKRRTSAK